MGSPGAGASSGEAGYPFDSATISPVGGAGLPPGSAHFFDAPVAAPVPPTVGLVDASTGLWHLRNPSGDVTSFYYGNPNDLPVPGDWDGDGIDTPGLYRSDGYFYARNSNSAGLADAACFAGNPSDLPLAGDWDGDGDDTLGLYRPSNQTFYLFNATCTGSPLGVASITFVFGDPGLTPLAADWDGDGVTEVGVYDPNSGILSWRNTHSGGAADGQIVYGDPADLPIAGDWGVVDGIDSPGIFRPSTATIHLRHTLTTGGGDTVFAFGDPGWLPIAGRWGLD